MVLLAIYIIVPEEFDFDESPCIFFYDWLLFGLISVAELYYFSCCYTQIPDKKEFILRNSSLQIIVWGI